VLATGAAELVLPFPGWTLPGVITVGAAQALLKAQPRIPVADLLPGRRVLVAGTGPLLLRAAADLVNHGATVVAICEAARPAGMLPGLPAALRHAGKLAEGAGYAATLARARPRVKMLSGWTVTGCYGDARVQQARVARVGSPARSRMFAADVVAVSHGLVPALDLSRALGCADEQLADFPAAVVVVDQTQATSASGVFACGELTGVGGAAKAEPEGEVAGLAAARHLGRLGETAFRRKSRAAIVKVRRARHFARLLARLYPLADHGWPDRLDPGTVVCRCEEATLADLRRAIAAGAADLRTIKGLTRCGTGYCQGRICGPVAQYAAARLTGRTLTELGDLHTRHLATPIPLSTLAASECEFRDL
jgi:NADPH-dependent 2,4-dienoyl-CoA reductase/sulfur reductase-like enzyme